MEDEDLFTVNTMAVYGLLMQGARASAAMVLTSLAWNIVVSTPEESTCYRLQPVAPFTNMV